MNTEELKAALAREAHVEPAVASAFVDALAAVVAEGLRTEGEAEVTGLGTFRTVEAQAGGRRVAFVTDDRMRDGVNAPFSCFEPITLDGPTAEPMATTAPTGSHGDVTGQTTIQSAADVPIGPNEAVVATSADDGTASEAVVAASADDGAASEAVVVTSADDGAASEAVVAAATPEAATTTPSPSGRRAGYSWWRVLLVLLLLGLVGLLVWWLVRGDTDSLATTRWEDTPSATVADRSSSGAVAPAEAVAAPSAQPMPEAATPQRRPSLPDVDSLPLLLDEDGDPVTHRLEEGERLTLVALEHYGDKAFWVYIYQANSDRLTSPNVVPVGTVVRLPDLKAMGIDTSSAAAVERAQLLAREILNN